VQTLGLLSGSPPRIDNKMNAETAEDAQRSRSDSTRRVESFFVIFVTSWWRAAGSGSQRL